MSIVIHRTPPFYTVCTVPMWGCEWPVSIDDGCIMQVRINGCWLYASDIGQEIWTSLQREYDAIQPPVGEGV